MCFRKFATPLLDKRKRVFEMLLKDTATKGLVLQLKLMALVIVYVEICAQGFSETLRYRSGNKAYKLLFLCNPYHELSAIKILLVSLLSFIVEYIFLLQFIKLLTVKCTYLLTFTV